MKTATYSILNKKIAHNGFLPIEEAEIHATVSDGKQITYTRERVLRADAVAVLLYNRDTDSIVLTQQFRFAIHDKNQGLLTEIPAGKVDPGEDENTTALRETLEECGIKVQKNDLVLLGSFFASPGYTAEKYFLFFASFDSTQKITAGGGLESENEFIQVFEVPVKEFYRQIHNNEIHDAKTLLAGLMAREKRLVITG